MARKEGGTGPRWGMTEDAFRNSVMIRGVCEGLPAGGVGVACERDWKRWGAVPGWGPERPLVGMILVEDLI